MVHRQLVVGAIILDSLDTPTRVLAARRSRPAELAGFWEFPGGKVEPDESPQEGLIREVAEELGVRIEVGDELAAESGSWPISDRYHLRLFFAVVTDGVLVPGESHDELRELRLDELDSVEWLPSDRLAIDEWLAARRGTTYP